MINGNLEQFLDTRWHMGAELFYNKHVYWCECVGDFDTGILTFTLERWMAQCDGKLYSNILTQNGQLADYQIVFTTSDVNMELIKKRFLEAPVFDGKTFWEVESDLIWVENSGKSIQM